MNTKPASQPLVGEDGELLNPDTTADPNAYADYVATYVRRDPLWFRAREHVRGVWCLYFVFAIILLVVAAALSCVLVLGSLRF